MPVAEMSAGFLSGLVLGVALGLVRPLVLLGALGIVAVLAFAGVSGVLDIFGRVAAEIGHHAPFFVALTIGKLVAAATVLR